MPKDPQLKITISTASFVEIAAALEQRGFKLGENVAEIILEKGTELSHSVNFKLATIRKDCALIASRVFQETPAAKSYNFIDFVDEIYNYVLHGKPAIEPSITDPKPEWK